MATCGDCGFLAVLRKGNANFPATIVTAPEEYRGGGAFFGAVGLVWGRPYCVQREVDFGQLVAPNPDWVDLQVALEIDRSACAGYYPFVLGFTPQDHMQMKVAERREKFEDEIRDRRDELERALQRQQLEFQAAQEERQATREGTRDKAMREREEKRDAETKTRYEEQMTTMRGNHRRELLVFGGAIALATIIAGMIQAAWFPIPGWWPF